MAKKILKLEVYDSTGVVVEKHKIEYTAGKNTRLGITIDKHQYWFSRKGDFVCEINVKKNSNNQPNK